MPVHLNTKTIPTMTMPTTATDQSSSVRSNFRTLAHNNTIRVCLGHISIRRLPNRKPLEATLSWPQAGWSKSALPVVVTIVVVAGTNLHVKIVFHVFRMKAQYRGMAFGNGQ